MARNSPTNDRDECAELRRRISALEGTVAQLRRRREPELNFPVLEIRVGAIPAGSTLDQGSSVSVQEISWDEDDVQVYTGRTDTVWEFFENLGGSVTGPRKIFYGKMPHWRRYVLLGYFCEESDSLPEE